MIKKARLNATDWVALGLSELAAHGPDAVKLEAICKAANVTRGSFYHHFKDHKTFLCAIAQAWTKQSTLDVAKKAESPKSVKERVTSLTNEALKIDYQLELGLRELARRMPEIREIVARTDQIRLSVLAKIYTERFGVGATEATELATLEYAAFAGMILLDPHMSTTAQRKLAAKFDAVIEQALRMLKD